MTKSAKYIILIVFTIFLAAGVYIFQPISAGVEAFTRKPPCSEPLRYTIGTIDLRFSISKNELESAVESAVETWNSGSDMQVLAEADDESIQADIYIQMVYDDRQDRTDRELRLRERIKSEQIRLDRRQNLHEQKRQQFDKISEEYRQASEETTSRLTALNDWVEEKNGNGGFMGNDLEEFERRKSELESAREAVRGKQRKLDRMAREINLEMDDINNALDKHNTLIEQYNDEFAGDLRFAKATYQKTANGGIVTINQFLNREELVLIIAHELGHALGIDHLRQPESVMYSVMEAQTISPTLNLTSEDKAAIAGLCD